MISMPPKLPLRLSLLAFAAFLTGCAVGPAYERPAALPAGELPGAYKEAAGWVQAAPADALERGPWWTLFEDPELDRLARQVAAANQDVAVAVANYTQARALVAQQRAALFPVVSLGAGADRAGGGERSADNAYRLQIGASWEPDVFGRLRSAVTGAEASAQASAADLASAILAAQGELAINYF